MGGKEKPFLYVDTHAGAGSYDLQEGYADKNREWEGGIQLLRSQNPQALPPSIARYLFIAGNDPAWYPGSPAIAQSVLRDRDRGILFELHPTDFVILRDKFSLDNRFQVLHSDGLGGLKAFLPPLSRRALVCIDPSYEIKEDYERVPQTLAGALKRFSTGIYMLWYPLLPAPEAQKLPRVAMDLYGGNRCRIEVSLRRPPNSERGMYGSGLVVFNPPWTLQGALEEALPYLSGVLGEPGAGYSIQWETPQPPSSRGV
jgi:23S rRNA (adenine2030-N6)-methyltransferase